MATIPSYNFLRSSSMNDLGATIEIITYLGTPHIAAMSLMLAATHLRPIKFREVEVRSKWTRSTRQSLVSSCCIPGGVVKTAASSPIPGLVLVCSARVVFSQFMNSLSMWPFNTFGGTMERPRTKAVALELSTAGCRIN